MTRPESYRLAMAAYHAGRYEKAAELLGPLTADGSDRQRQLLCRYYLGQSEYRLGIRRLEQQRYAEATRHFQAAASMNAGGGGFARFLVACHFGTRRLDLASRELETLVRQEPTNIELRVKLALSQYQMGNRLEAMTTLREGLCHRADQAELHYQLGVMLAADDDLSEAERCFERALLFDGSHAGACERLAHICALTGRSDRARRHLLKAHELDPFSARIAFQLSLLCRSGAGGMPEPIRPSVPSAPAELDHADIERLGQIVVEEPDFLTAFLSLPESEVDEEVFTTLAAILEEALRNHPEFADLHYHCGAVCRRLGRRVDAIAHTERAVGINPRYVNALIQLAELYDQTDQWAMGVERLEQAVAGGGDYPDVHLMLGRLYQAGGQPHRARRAFEHALELNDRYEAARQSLKTLAM
ncbi:MAG TPA: tetratricopeptide repeat protein [Phycisphaerae bacterium]|nr:tetratricopeptide repeat protein [Phycisphaerae bacterium]